MSRHRGLGKGLDEILATDWGEFVSRRQIVYVPLDEIQSGEHQPRQSFPDEKLRELADSIREQGVLQPIILHQDGQYYRIVAGERRWRAAKVAGLDDIPAIIVDFDDPSVLALIALVENLQREDLNPMEEASALKRLKDEFALTQDEVAQKIGKSRSAVANIMRLLNLPEKIQSMLVRGELTEGQGRVLLSVKDDKKRLRLAILAATRGLSVQRLAIIAKDEGVRTTKKKVMRKDPRLSVFEDQLVEYLGTKVSITKGKKKGKIVIEFYDDKQLNEILEKLGE